VKVTESARSIPDRTGRSSGTRAAAPPRLHPRGTRDPSPGRFRPAPERIDRPAPVVPAVATIRNGKCPAARSDSIFSAGRQGSYATGDPRGRSGRLGAQPAAGPRRKSGGRAGTIKDREPGKRAHTEGGEVGELVHERGQHGGMVGLGRPKRRSSGSGSNPKRATDRNRWDSTSAAGCDSRPPRGSRRRRGRRPRSPSWWGRG
jgi:hypothetical protein